jgi:hypothetical protein
MQVLQGAVHDFMEAYTRQNAAEGVALLRGAPWNRAFYFQIGVEGYLAALPNRTDWRALRSDLSALLEERARNWAVPDVDGKREEGERASVDLAIAREWAQRDLSAAMEWYAADGAAVNADLTPGQRTLNVLSAIPAAQRFRVADWLQAGLWSGQVKDDLVVAYGGMLANTPPDATVERLVAMPSDEERRVAILSSFATPEDRDGQKILRHPPEVLHRLVEAADLSEPVRERWLQTIESAIWEES